MQNEKNEKKVKQVIELYKLNLAKLMRKGQAGEVVTLLQDSGGKSARDKNLVHIAKKSIRISSPEELELARVNFVFSLLLKPEKELIVNEFLLEKSNLWWVNDYSRSTYYRLRRRACKKFMDYYGNEKK